MLQNCPHYPYAKETTCLDVCHSVALTLIVMKCFERLVMTHTKNINPPTLDPLQFAYRHNHFTVDAMSSWPSHTCSTKALVKMEFTELSSAFTPLYNTLCNWILDVLTDRSQAVGVYKKRLHSFTLNPGAPQGCVLSHLLFMLLTHDYVAQHLNKNLLPERRSVGCPLLQICVHLDGLIAEDTFHCWLYSV